MMLDERDWSPVELQALKDVMMPSCTADIQLNVLDLGRMVDGKFGDGYEELLVTQAADIIDNYSELYDALLDAEVSVFDMNQLFVNGEPLENTPFEPFADLVVEYWKSAETLKTEAVQTPRPEPRTDPGSDTGCSQCDYLINSVEEDSAFCVQYGMTETGSFPAEEAAKQLGMTVSEYEMTMETICD